MSKISAGSHSAIVVPRAIAESHDISVGTGSLVVIFDDPSDLPGAIEAALAHVGKTVDAPCLAT